MAEDEVKKARIREIRSQISTFENYEEKQLGTFDREIERLNGILNDLKKRREHFEKEMRDKKKELERKKAELEY